MGLKTHCKLSMLVRRDQDRLRRYAHLGTGNYNHTTARLYTDLGLITAEPTITAEVAEVFNLLTAHNRASQFEKLLVAPAGLMQGMLDRIERESQHARTSRPAAIIAKMNGLMDPAIIRALFQASQAGVEIDLIVRGICCLRAGLNGISENIPRVQHYWPLLRAQPGLLLCQRRRRGSLARQRGLDESQPARPGRGRLPHLGPGPEAAHLSRAARARAGRSRQISADAPRTARTSAANPRSAATPGHSVQELLMRAALGEDIDALES